MTEINIHVRISKDVRDAKSEYPVSGISQYLKTSSHNISNVKLLKKHGFSQRENCFQSYFINTKENNPQLIHPLFK